MPEDMNDHQGKLSVVCIGLVFSTTHSSQAALSYGLKGPETGWSNGCSLWLQCDGRVSIVTPLRLASSRQSHDSWLSKMSNTCLTTPHPVWWIKCIIHCKKVSAFIQLEGLVMPSELGGQPMPATHSVGEKNKHEEKWKTQALSFQLHWHNNK